MDPPTELRQACDPVMRAASVRNYSRETIALLERLKQALVSTNLDGFLEYALLPLLFLVPDDAREAAEVPQRVLEAGFECFAVIAHRQREAFAIREDLFVPVALRAIASLTDASRDGQLNLQLKEETKISAIRVIRVLIQCLPIGPPISFLQDNVVFHTCALLLDAATKDKAREIKLVALQCLEEFVLRITGNQLVFIFPGTISALTALAAGDYKLGSDVLESSTRVMTVAIDRRFSSPIKDLDKDNEDGDESTFEKMFELLVNVLSLDISEDSVPVEVRRARVELVSVMLTTCKQDLSNNDAHLNFCLKRLISFCADSNERVSSKARERLVAIRNAELEPFLEKMFLSTMLALKDIRVKEDEALLSSHFRTAQFLVETCSTVKIQASLEGSIVRVVWSLLLAFSCDASRFELMGRIEYDRLTKPESVKAALCLLDTVKMRLEQVSTAISELLLESVEMFFSSPTDDNSGGEELNLPLSCMAQAIVLASVLSGDQDSLLERLIEITDLWNLPVVAGKKVTPTEATWNAMSIASALEAIARCAEHKKLAFKYSLVDALFPILQCLGSEHTGLKLSAQMCLERIAKVCQYPSESDLLQENVDYVVDALMRRLPYFNQKDLAFANIIEALVARIPVWVGNDQQDTSPWMKDLVETVMNALDDRFSSPQVSWTLLRICLAIVSRGSPKKDNLSEELLKDDTAANDENEKELNGILEELRMFYSRSSRSDPAEDAEDEDEQPIDERMPDARKRERDQIVASTEAILGKTLVFVCEEDALVRTQAANVAIACVNTLSALDRDKAYQACVRAWPSLVGQIRHERHPAVLALILQALLAATETVQGQEFFAHKFAEDLWPVLEVLLERAAKKNASSRDLELSKRVLECLKDLGAPLLRPKAGRIASVTGKIFQRGETSWGELRRLAGSVWETLTIHAGDAVWLSVAISCGHVQASSDGQSVVRLDKPLATKLWAILEKQ